MVPERVEEERLLRMIHDLRNPLAVLMTNIEYVLAETALSGEARAALEDSLAAGRRMTRQLESSLDLARLERGDKVLKLAPVDLGGLLNMVADRYRAVARDAKLQIETRVAPGLRANLDLDLVACVLQNIIDNAIRYTRSGGRIRISVGPSNRSRFYEIRVANTGEPIPLAMRASLLDRPPAPKEPQSMCRDLGLYFGRLAIEAHGGRLRFVEEPEFPVVFVLEIPKAT